LCCIFDISTFTVAFLSKLSEAEFMRNRDNEIFRNIGLADRHATRAEGRYLLTSLDSYDTASLNSITDTSNNNCDFTHVNYFSVEDRDLGKLRTIAHEALHVMRGLNFGWKAFWNSNRK
jgi:hypothetical protein